MKIVKTTLIVIATIAAVWAAVVVLGLVLLGR
jgi:hypothetical protein